MKDEELEALLRDSESPVPGEFHERRMERLFEEARRDSVRTKSGWNVKTWQLAAGALFCLGVGYGMGQLGQPIADPPVAATPVEPVVYVVEAPEFPSTPVWRPRPSVDQAFWDNPPEVRVAVRDAQGRVEVIESVTEVHFDGGVVQ